MPTPDTSDIMQRFNNAFLEHNPDLLSDLIAADCVMESIQPAPNGTRYEGREACLAFWQALAADRTSSFELEDVIAAGNHATIRWRFHFGQDQSVRGVNLMRVQNGQIVEAMGYSKVPGEPAPLPR